MAFLDHFLALCHFQWYNINTLFSDSRDSILDLILCKKFSILNNRFSILDEGFLILDSRYLILAGIENRVENLDSQQTVNLQLTFKQYLLLNSTVILILENLRFSIPEWQAFKTMNLVSSKLIRVNNYQRKMIIIKLTFRMLQVELHLTPLSPFFRGNRDIHSDETVKITVHTFFSGQY